MGLIQMVSLVEMEFSILFSFKKAWEFLYIFCFGPKQMLMLKKRVGYVRSKWRELIPNTKKKCKVSFGFTSIFIFFLISYI